MRRTADNTQERVNNIYFVPVLLAYLSKSPSEARCSNDRFSCPTKVGMAKSINRKEKSEATMQNIVLIYIKSVHPIISLPTSPSQNPAPRPQQTRALMPKDPARPKIKFPTTNDSASKVTFIIHLFIPFNHFSFPPHFQARNHFQSVLNHSSVQI